MSRLTCRLLLPALCLAAAFAGPAHAAGPQANPKDAPVPAKRLAYVTQSGRQMPIYQFPEYQSARRRWLAGFVIAMSGIGLVATGVAAFIFGGAPGSGLSESGRSNAMVVG